MNKKLLLSSILAFVILGLYPHSVNADISGAIGSIDPPPGVEEQNIDFMNNGGGNLSTGDNIALFFFLSKFLVVVNVVAGIWVLVNLSLAGFAYISSQGKAEAHQLVRDKLTMSVAGLALLVVAYMAIAILSALFFGDPGFILNPKL